MSEHGVAHGHGVASPISVLWVVAASLIGAAGLFVIFWWLYNFNLEFAWGPFLVLLSVLMFLDRRAGWDHA
ncbi:MAG TPA: hypothetical protein VMC82_03425 [Thermoplasmata archaeon]|nr:hypothetical protein [Thermoplasmata archaeon]